MAPTRKRRTSSNPNSPPAVRSKPTAVPPGRNILSVVLGDTLFKTWYPSFYPEELIGKSADRLYICRWCFRYSKEVVNYVQHVGGCELRETGPPGKLIYKKGQYGVWEVDGEEHKLFAQNLSLFAKLFLDNKSVFFDVPGFHYYLLVHDPTPDIPSLHPIGFFSKEKMSWDNNNLACILVFPPWQERRLGQILMGVSYELSRRQGRIGGPEKPLSEMGRGAYLKFWMARVAREVLTQRNKSSLTVEELAANLSMLVDDVVAALKEMGICEVRKKGDGLSVSKVSIREWAERKSVNLAPPVDEDAFLEKWEPSKDEIEVEE